MPTDLTLTIIVFFPIVGALAVLCLPVATDLQRFRIRSFTLLVTLIPLALAVFDLLGEVGNNSAGSLPQPTIDAPWLRGSFFQLDYHLGTDGLNLLLLFAATVVFPALVLASWRQRERYRSYFCLLLLMETGITGAFATQDLGLFIIFFWLPVVPMALLVSFGDQPRSITAAIRLFAVQSSAALALLAGTLVLLLHTGNTTLNFQTLATVQALKGTPAVIVFVLFLYAFVARMGAFPLQRWFVDGVEAAPTPVGMLLAVSAIPVGGYGLIRIAVGIDPVGAARLVVPLLAIALVTIWWGALSSRAGRELKRLSANTLVAVAGLVILGAASFSETSLGGAIFLAFSLMFVAPLLLLVTGAVAERALLAKLLPLRGAAAGAPRLKVLFAIGAAALVGVPLLAGFPGLFQILVGSFAAHRFVTALAVVGLLLLTAALWRAGHRVFWSPPLDDPEVTVTDAKGSEFYAGWLLAGAVVIFGISAGYFIPYVVQGTDLVAARVSSSAPAVSHPTAVHK